MKNSTGKNKQVHPSSPSDSVFRLIGTLVAQFVRSIPIMGLRLLIGSLGVFILINFINYYVIAELNQGYGSGNVTGGNLKPWIWLFNFGENKAAFGLLSFFLPLLLSSLWAQIRKFGLKVFFRNLVHVFSWTGSCLYHAGRYSLPALLLSAAFMLPLGLFTNNTALYVTMALGAFFAYTSQNNNLTFQFARAGWNDWQRLFRKKSPLSSLNQGIGGMLPFGFFFGLVILAILPSNLLKLLSGILFLIFMAGGVFFFRSFRGRSAVAAILVFIGLNLFWYAMCGRAFADDAGADELLTFGNYIRDPGGQMVLKSGLLPGGAGVLGVWIGQLGGLSQAPERADPRDEPGSMNGTPYFPFDLPGGPDDNPFTSFEGDNPCS